MTLGQYLMKLASRWKLIVICVVILGVGAFIGSKLMNPIYQSTVVIQIALRSSNNQTDYNSLLASEQLMQTESDLAVSGPVLREVASHYPGLTVVQLTKEVTSTPKLDTQLFEINVQDQSPTRAAALANDIAATLIKYQTQSAQQGSNQTQQKLQQELNSTQKQINDTTKRIEALPPTGGNQALINTLEIQLNNLQQQDIQLQSALVQLELAQNNDFLSVVQPAQPVLTPFQPNIILNTGVGLFVGVLLAMTLVLLFEQVDTRIHTPEVLSQVLEWPVLTTILQAESKEEVINPKKNNFNVEAYRILRTNIGFSAIDKLSHTIMVTSAAVRDGKSTVAANLAIFMAKAGKNTLLIDADFRHPKQHEQFGLPAQTKGLSDAILAFSMPSFAKAAASQQFLAPTSSPLPFPTSSVSLNQFFYTLNIPNLCVMPTGPLPPNPPELLDSKAMQYFLAAIDSCGAEVIIFDAPPLIGLSDASILASKVDSTLVVVDITRANRGNLKQMKAMLVQTGAHVLGTVVNKQRRSNDHTTPYSYYSTDQEQNDLSNQSKNGNSSSSHFPPTILKQIETQAQFNMYGR